jgi:hypothetical protein
VKARVSEPFGIAGEELAEAEVALGGGVVQRLVGAVVAERGADLQRVVLQDLADPGEVLVLDGGVNAPVLDDLFLPARPAHLLAVQRYAVRDILEGQGVMAILPKWRLVISS